ncbi:MAG: DMT family transporter [Pseudomonadota bacterium]
MDNLRGAFLMTLAMAGFAAEDALIKALSASWPPGQVILFIGALGAPVFAVMARAQGLPLFSRALAHPAILARCVMEMLGTLCFVSALALIPLSLASAILQAAPLLVTLGAALFLGEAVGWRRWTAILVGLAGVLLILRPGRDAFEPAAILAILGTLGLAGRDIAVRRVPPATPSIQLAWLGFLSIIPAGLLLMAFDGVGAAALDTQTLPRALAAVVVGLLAYYAIVQATRIGEISVVTPFRYTRLVFALVIGVIFFSERPDALTLTGAAIVVASGLYTLAREARLKRRAA